MADQEKEISSVDSKDGSTKLEEGIGKEFLSSWKSISMADDDAMDFSFDSVSKGKKKTFNFGKLDMDFNLDGEFDKISSFKVDMSDLDFSCSPKKHPKSKENKEGDMSDLDFSCSPKKPTKPKGNKGGESSGAKEMKQNNFDFSFDFNEMDSFNLDSSLMKGDKTSTSNLNKKVTSDGSDNGVAKESKPKDDERGHASNDSMATKPPASEMVETSKVEVMVGNQRDLGSTQDGSVSKVSSSGKLDMLIENTLGISTTSTEESDQERELPEKTKSSELKSQDINNRPSKSVGQNDSNQDTSLDQHTAVYSPGAKVNTGSGGKQNVINNGRYLGSDGVKLPLENSSLYQISKSESSDGEAIKFVGSTQAEATDDSEPVKSDASFENNTKAVLLKQISHDNVENQNSTLEGHLATESSKHVVDKVMLMKNKEIKGIQSKFFGKREDNNIPSKHNLLTAGTKGVSFGSQRIGDMQRGSITKANDNFKSNDSDCGTKSVPGSTPATSEPVREELVLLGDNDVKISSKAREGIVSDGIPSGGNLPGNMQPIHIEEKKSKTLVLETDMSSKDVKLQSSQVNSSCLTEKTARHATQMPVNLQAHNSDKESFKNLSVNMEGNKLSSVKAAKITSTLSGFKTSKTGGTNKVLTTSIRQKETNSSGNSLQTELQGITASKSDIDNAENLKPATFSLKRKTMEDSESDLVPLRSLKRLSQSPSKSSSYNECPEKVVEKVKSRPNSLHCNSPAHGLESAPDVNLMEVKLPASVLVEDNGNVEKAEAYTKELEDICNMLKKKHEEAKELIVRAVVNNNNLLMLNHPIYEEKIRKVQKLTLQLMSKGIQT